MCGIAGFLDPGSNRSPESMRRHVRDMTNCLAHRGPDDEGAWVDPTAGVALGNRRLAIIDLSPEGHQPMHFASGRYVITYNGEIYNSVAIARTLDSAGLAPRWRGHSDTEVILAAIEAWASTGRSSRSTACSRSRSGMSASEHCAWCAIDLA